MQVITRRIFREPHHGVIPWILLLLGCVELAGFLFYTTQDQLYRLIILITGLLLFLGGSAELLPRNWTTAAGLLRIGSFVVFLAALSAALVLAVR